ncbi:Hydrogenase-4 component A [Edwardsiella tarda]|nr:Hydrogenase-4 component A [Edwardsiella tarda]
MNRFVIADPRLCIGCNTCMAACAQEHEAQGLQAQPRLTLVKTSHESAPQMCHHCEDAPCALVCPVNAITHQDGAVQLNESLCVGCKLCGIACPSAPSPWPAANRCIFRLTATRPWPPGATGAPQRWPFLDWYPGIRSIAVKCDLCQFSEAGPACVRACPTHAIMLVDERRLEAASAAKRLHVLDAQRADLLALASLSGGNDAQ